MSIDILTRLNTAQNDDERAELVLEFYLQSFDPSLREAVRAAAVPHWFDAAFIAVLLHKSEDEVSSIFEHLIKLSFVEVYQGKGYNIHERTRAVLLKRLWQGKPKDRLKFNQRAALHCADQNLNDADWQIESIYHQLLIRSADAFQTLEGQIQMWKKEFNFSKIEAIAQTIIAEREIVKFPAKVISFAYYEKAYSANFRGRYTEAISNLEKALPLVTQAINKASINRLMGEAYAAQGLRDKAYEYFGKAIESVASEENSYRVIYSRAVSTFALSRINWAMGRVEAARSNASKAKILFQKTDDDIGIASCKVILGEILTHAGKHRGGRKLLEEALTVFRMNDAKLNTANAQQAIGMSYFMQDSFLSGLKHLEEARALYTKIQHPYGAAKVLFIMSVGIGKLGNMEQKKQCLEEARSLFHLIGNKEAEKECNQELEAISEET